MIEAAKLVVSVLLGAASVAASVWATFAAPDWARVPALIICACVGAALYLWGMLDEQAGEGEAGD